MSKQVDERVVEMRFDNKQFEANVQTSISTLDKLKKSLHLDGAVKGLETVDKAAKKIDMSNLGKSVETVRAKFSALEVMGVTALANITNSAVNAGKRMVKALTIDPVRTGFNEYELKMNSIQTIMASTGEELETVNKYLNELNEYSDKTIYSFSDMTQNIGKFTNAGVKLEDAVAAIKGVSNVAAVSGANANEASRSMYNFAQALSAGYVKLIDWKSIELANMATVEFKNQLIEAAVAAGTLTEAGDGMYKTLKGNTMNATKNFNDTLTDQWMTTEVLVNTLRDYSDETTEIGAKASKAATRVTTFSKMLDTLKETAQSGWAQSWEIIFGDFEEGTNLWTKMNKIISGWIGKIDDIRNSILRSAFGRTFTSLSEKLSGVLTPAKKAAETIKTVTDTVEDLGGIVDKVIRGDFGNGEKRINALTEAGYNYAQVQNKVNEKLGSSVRHAVNLTESQNDLNASQEKAATTQKNLTKEEAKNIETLTEMNDAQLENAGYTKDQIKAIRELREEADKLGIPVSEFIEQIDELNSRTILSNAFSNIGKAISDVFSSIKGAWKDIFPSFNLVESLSNGIYDLIAAFHKLSVKMQLNDGTAEKITRTFKGVFAAIDLITTVVGGPIKLAFNVLTDLLGAFDLNLLDLTAMIGDAIVKFNDWVQSILDFSGIIDNVKEWAGNMKTSFVEVGSSLIEGLREGLSGSFLGKIWKVITGIGEKILDTLCRILGINSPSKETYEIGQNVVQGFINGLADSASGLFDVIKKICSSVVKSFKDFDWSTFAFGLSALVDFFPIFGFLKPLASLARYFNAAGVDATEGLIQGLVDGAKHIWDAVVNIGKTMLTAICDVLGIHSPSVEFHNIGINATQGLANGLIEATSSLGGVIGSIVTKIFGWFKELDLSKIFSSLDMGKLSSILWTASAFFTKLPILNTFAALTNMAVAFGGDLVDGLKNGVSDGTGGMIQAILNFGNSIINAIKNVFGIHSPSKVFWAIGGFLIAGLIGGLAADAEGVVGTIGAICTNLFNFTKDFFFGFLDFIKNLNVGQVIAIALTVGILVAVKKIMDIIKSFSGLANGFKKVCNSASGLMDAFTDKISGKTDKFSRIADNMLKMAGAIAILSIAVYLLTIPDYGKVWNAVGAVAVLTGIIAGLAIAMDKFKVKGADFGKITLLLLGIAGAMLIVSRVMKTLSGMEWDELGKASAGLGGLLAFLTLLMLITKIGNAKKVGSTLMQMAGAMVILTFVAKSIAKMEWNEMGKAAAGLAGLVAFMALLMLVTKIGNSKKIGTMLLSMAGAIAILTMVAKSIARMEWSEMGKAAVGLGGLIGFLALLMLVTKIGNYKKVGSMLLAMSGAIAILALTAKLIASMEWDDMGKAAVGLVGLGLIMALLIKVTKGSSGDYNKLGATMLAVAGAIGILALIAIILGMVPLDKLAIGVGAVAILGSIMALLINVTKNAQKCAGTIVTITIALAVLLAGVYMLASFPDPNRVMGAAIAVSIVMGMLIAVMAVAKNLSTSIGGIIAITAMIGVLAGALYLLAGLPVESVTSSAISLAVLMAVLVGCMWAVTKIQAPSAKAIGALVVMTMAIGVLAGALYLLAGVPIEKMIPGAVALGVLMLALVGSMMLISGIQSVSVTALVALGIMTAALGVLAGALWLIAGMPIANALVGALALGTLMVALAASMMLISGVGAGAIAGAAAMVIMAGALAILTPCLQTLGNMSLGQIGVGLLALAGAFAVIGVAGLLLAPIAVPIMALAAAIALIGAGCLMAGTGVLSFVTALNMFLVTAISMAGQGPAITAGITAIITGICMAIVNSVTAITTAITAIVASICQCIVTCIPMILATAGVALSAFLAFIVTYIPKMVDAGMKLVMGILQGIADNIGGIIDAATDIIVNFLDGIGRNIPRVIDSGIKLVISFINGMANGIRNNTGSMISAVDNLMDAVMDAVKKWFSNSMSKGKELVGKLVSGVKSKLGDMKSAAKSMMDGFIKGIGEKFGAIKEKAVNAVKGAVGAVKKFLGIKSPSREFMKIGRYSDEGLALGLKKYAKVAGDAASDLGLGILDSIQKTLKIHSPSLVFDEEVGRYVVQGVAEGIKSDMTAEEAAEKKAQNIVTAFRDAMDKRTLDMKTLDLESKMIDLEENASGADVIKSKVDKLVQKAAIQEEAVTLAESKWMEMIKHFGENDAKTTEAYNEYLESKISHWELLKEIKDTKDSMADELRELDLDSRDLEYELWLNNNDSTATEVDKLIAKMNNLTHKITDQTKEVEEAEQEYLNALNSYGKDDVKTKQLYNNLLQSKIDLSALTKEYNEANQSLIAEQKAVTDKNRECVDEYYKYIVDNKEALLAMGLTMQDIEKEAARVSGFDPTAGTNAMAAKLNLSSEAINNSAKNMEQASGTLQSASADSMASMLLSGAETLKTLIPEWSNAGAELVKGFANGITEGVQEVVSQELPEVVSAATLLKNSILAAMDEEMVISPVIRPVLDMSNIQNGAGIMNGLFTDRSVLANVQAGFAGMDTSALNDISNNVSHISADLKNNTNTTSSGFAEVNFRIQKLEEAIRSMRVVLDTGTIAGAIDNELGHTANYKGRGN